MAELFAHQSPGLAIVPEAPLSRPTHWALAALSSGDYHLPVMGDVVARIYQWTEDEDEIAPDAITVGITADTRLLTIAGLRFGQRDAVVYWPDWTGSCETVAAALEGPMPVKAALERADALCARYGFHRVVIWLQHRELWDDVWGNLEPSPGL